MPTETLLTRTTEPTSEPAAGAACFGPLEPTPVRDPARPMG